MGLGGDGKKRGKSQAKPESSDSAALEVKRMAVMGEINFESTLFGLWFVNLAHIMSFVFMSFVVCRFWSTTM